MCLLLRPWTKKINVQKNPRQSFLSLLSLPLAFIIKLFILLKKSKKPLTNLDFFDIILTLHMRELYYSLMQLTIH